MLCLLTNAQVHLGMTSLMHSLLQRLLQTLQSQLHVVLLVAGENPSVPSVLVTVVLCSLHITPFPRPHGSNDHIAVLVNELV